MGSRGGRSPELSPSPTVIWHDLECGLYRADIPLWLELARQAPAGAILDVGAGTGRVTLALARAGRRVIAVDLEPELLAALAERARELDVRTLCADARSLALPDGERVSLCVVPMQTMQLLGGAEGRLAFLRGARALLPAGGLLACAIVTELEAFDCTAGGPGPSAERVRVDGVLYVSQATRVELRRDTVVIERERTSSACAQVERNLIELDRLTVEQLEREAAAVGLRVEPARQVAPTDDHAGSSVVMLRV